jgi:hypothetical protein
LFSLFTKTGRKPKTKPVVVPSSIITRSHAKISNLHKFGLNPENASPSQPTTNVEQSLKDMLVETLQAMNNMITKLANLPQLQQNQNFTNPNVPQTNLNHEIQQSEEQNLNNNHIGSANTPRSEQSPAISQFDPLKSRIDRVEAEL